MSERAYEDGTPAAYEPCTDATTEPVENEPTAIKIKDFKHGDRVRVYSHDWKTTTTGVIDSDGSDALRGPSWRVKLADGRVETISEHWVSLDPSKEDRGKFYPEAKVVTHTPWSKGHDGQVYYLHEHEGGGWWSVKDQRGKRTAQFMKEHENSLVVIPEPEFVSAKSRFKEGDRVRVNRPGDRYHECIGELRRIPFEVEGYKYWNIQFADTPFSLVDRFHECILEPVPPKPASRFSLGCRVRVAPGQKTTIADELCVIIGKPAEDAWEIESLETGLTSTGFYDNHLIFVAPPPKPVNRDVLIVQPGVWVTLRERDELGRNLPAGRIRVSHLNPLARTWRGYKSIDDEWMTEFEAKDVTNVSFPDDEPDAPATPEPAKHHLLDGLVAHHVFEKKQQPAPAVAYDPREPEAVASGKPHYYAKLRDAGCEPFAVIAACLPLEKAIAYHQATAIAYLIRAEHKHDSPDDDIRKAHAHLAEAVRLIDRRTA